MKQPKYSVSQRIRRRHQASLSSYSPIKGYAGQAEKMILAFVNAGEIAISKIQQESR
jgi:hypothetical protein